MTIYDCFEAIQTKADFERFLEMLVEDFKGSKDDWENDSLKLFLEALHGYNFDSKNDPEETIPSWRVFAEMLLAARVYE